jgi:hypothetical protein
MVHTLDLVDLSDFVEDKETGWAKVDIVLESDNSSVAVLESRLPIQGRL